MKDQDLITAINDYIAKAASSGLPVACMANSHFGELIIPSADAGFSIPRGFFTEENAPTGDHIGGFPTFRSASHHDAVEITPSDEAMMEEIRQRIGIITAKSAEKLTAAKIRARELAESGMTVNEACESAASETGENFSRIRHEFHHREIHRNTPRSRWGNKTA
jgi:hypothetical protein